MCDGFHSRLHFARMPGLKDYAALYWIDEGSTDILIRNAEKIVEVVTSHKLHTPKNGGPVRVSLTPRTWFGERIRPAAGICTTVSS